MFPNVGFTIAIIQIAAALESETFLWVGTGMTIAVCPKSINTPIPNKPESTLISRGLVAL